MKFATLIASGAFLLGAIQAPAMAAAGACPELVFPASLAKGDNAPFAMSSLVRHWLGGAITDTFTYKFTQIGSVPKPCAFSEAAWAKFRSRARLDEYETKIKDVQAVGASVLAQPPLIMAQGIGEGGDYLWKVEVQIVPWLETVDARTPDATRTVRMVVAKGLGEGGKASWRVVDVM